MLCDKSNQRSVAGTVAVEGLLAPPGITGEVPGGELGPDQPGGVGSVSGDGAKPAVVGKEAPDGVTGDEAGDKSNKCSTIAVPMVRPAIHGFARPAMVAADAKTRVPAIPVPTAGTYQLRPVKFDAAL